MTEAPAPAAEETPLGALAAANARRRRTRRWLLLGTLPLSLAALLLVVKLLSMYALAHSAILSHVSGDAQGTIRAASWQAPLNWFEPWKAPFNLGVGHAAGGEFAEARLRFEEALPLVTEELESCGVRVNLALVIEELGKERETAGSVADALILFREAATVVRDTPEACHSEEADQRSTDPSRSMGDSLDELRERLDGRLSEDDPGQGQSGEGEQPEEGETGDGGAGTPDEGPGPSDSQLDELGKQLEQGDRERDQFGRGDEDGFGWAEKPW